MKTQKLPKFCLVLFIGLFSISCYEPIANTSGASDYEKETKLGNVNISSEVIEKKEDIKKPVSKKDEEKMSETESKNKDIKTTEGFRENLNQNLRRSGLAVTDIYDSSSLVESRILKEYGSVFLTKAMPPAKTMFTNEEEVLAFQSKAGSATAIIGGSNVELQASALKALQAAVADAKSQNLNITPRDKKANTDSAKRTYKQTLDLWNDRFYKACEYWKNKKRLTAKQISRLKSLPIKEQVQGVLELEKKGIYFSTFFNQSILYSVAAPGTSQHLSMLAFDATEFQNKKVRQILAKHGWFRTVQNDEPHFTYLGRGESELPKLGLKRVIKKDGEFWIPNL